MRHSVCLILIFLLTACASPSVQKISGPAQSPELDTGYAVMQDGYRLPVAVWESDSNPEAMILALHGFNDYRNAFHEPARYFAARRITTYAYDQRGFGETTQHGIWPDTGILDSDAAEMAGLLCRRHPELPLFLLGESMGGAVIMNMQLTAPCLKGMILVGPAVWGWETMPFWQRYALRLAAHITPGKTLTGEGLNITPSDNVKMLHALGRDPLVIKATRIDAMYGLTNLMQSALLASAELITLPSLILYGEKDEIIPRKPVCNMLNRLPDTATTRFVLYPQGYHMLMRDLQAPVVLRDILSWIRDQAAMLPSGLETGNTSDALKMLCR